jgi:signal transduction histidine kinase
MRRPPRAKICAAISMRAGAPKAVTTMAADPSLQAGLETRLTELMRQQRELIDRLQHGQQHFQQLARSVWRVQEDERRRLARDLHDGIGQNLTAIMHLLSRVQAELPAAAAAAQPGLEKIRAIAATTLEETRTLSRLLRPQILDDLGLEPALRWLARTFGATHGVTVRLDIQQPPPALDGDRSTLIFRLVQEALTNVARHARAQHVDIALRQQADRVLLRIEDDGCGCDAAAAQRAGSDGRGSGLGGMRDRVLLFNGDFAVQSQPGAGLRISVGFPLPPGTQEAGP